MPIHTHLGGEVLSEHARHRLNARLHADGLGSVTGARFLHFAECEQMLEAEEEALLAKLLDYAPACKDVLSGLPVTIVPRFGTISPWSSKATEIVRLCGLTRILRLERGIEYYVQGAERISAELASILHDRMTESVLPGLDRLEDLFRHPEPVPLAGIDLEQDGAAALRAANMQYGLALSDADIEYLLQAYAKLGRAPTDAELMMFAQVNSEHCRHKIFNGRWTIDGQPAERSLFAMIRNTHAASPDGVLSAYRDNAAVLAAGRYARLAADPKDRFWRAVEDEYGIVIKVETHNHPTGISPFPGAATGSGGEIRDETACGRGGRPKAGLCGFTVSNLNLDDWLQPWENPERAHPSRMASPLEIMIEGPVGAASFNNEFGRPCLAGYFRTLEIEADAASGRRMFGYHKPIMVAGGMGSIRARHIQKSRIPEGAPIVVLGGPAMLIGLGGGAASSQHTGMGEEGLDFASVQRSNPEMQRRAQEVVEQCVAQGDDNPILSVHDVGAGGLSNAIPELVDGEPGGSVLELRDIPCAESGMSPREIWCNESQERYVLALRSEALDEFAALCDRERSPFAVIGYATADGRLRVTDRLLKEVPVDVPLPLLFGESSRMHLEVASSTPLESPLDTSGMTLDEAVARVLALPGVGSKSFLITIGDRSVGGLTVRDQMVGPWQVPVADAAVTASDFAGFSGEAMACRSPSTKPLNVPCCSTSRVICFAKASRSARASARRPSRWSS